jgi:hypothetical protein
MNATQNAAQPQLPQLSGQIRVLVIDDDMMAAHPILARCAEAGMDARYAPWGKPALEAVRDAHPHIIILSDIQPQEHSVKLGLFIRKMTLAPVLLLTTYHTNVALWHGVSSDPNSFLPKDAAAQDVLERAALLVKAIYHESQLMISEAPLDGSGTTLPSGWGKCTMCGYIGPKTRFANPTLLGRHSHVCPKCKHAENIVFAM